MSSNKVGPNKMQRLGAPFLALMALSCASDAAVTTTTATPVTTTTTSPKTTTTVVTTSTAVTTPTTNSVNSQTTSVTGATTAKPATATVTGTTTPTTTTVGTSPTSVTGVTISTGTTGTTTTTTTTASASGFGTFDRPFAASSPWNSRPINPVFGTFVIPTSSYYPSISNGAYSTGMFLAKASDGPMTVVGLNGAAGPGNPDTGMTTPITLPHWPASAVPATGSDGHADIYDETTGIVHSFWVLKNIGGKWQAAMYAWMPINGSGWGNPAHYYQGARATAVPASAGLIRAKEVDDGLPTYRHALAMSLTYNGLSAKQTYTYPATSSDWNASTTNTGQIPQGALMMLPPSYDSSKANPKLKKIIETLKLYGAYVVDRNTGTPFALYVENGTPFDIFYGKSWDNAAAAELDKIRANLRQVVSAQSWVDGDGKAVSMTPPATINRLSMRGPWARASGTATADFDSWSQSLKFSPTTTKTVFNNTNVTGLSKVTWATIPPSSTQKFTVTATNGATLRMVVYSGNTVVANSGELGNGGSARFVWPASGGWFVLTATSGTGNVVSTVSADLSTVTP